MLELFQIRRSIILSVSREEDVHPTVCPMLGAFLFSPPLSLQMRNFLNSMLAETPLGELVEER